MEMTQHHCKYRGRDDAENYDIDVWVTFDQSKHVIRPLVGAASFPLGRALVVGTYTGAGSSGSRLYVEMVRQGVRVRLKQSSQLQQSSQHQQS
jgi:hypothetical protein